jgi:hypothetical protein
MTTTRTTWLAGLAALALVAAAGCERGGTNTATDVEAASIRLSEPGVAPPHAGAAPVRPENVGHDGVVGSDVRFGEACPCAGACDGSCGGGCGAGADSCSGGDDDSPAEAAGCPYLEAAHGRCPHGGGGEVGARACGRPEPAAELAARYH